VAEKYPEIAQHEYVPAETITYRGLAQRIEESIDQLPQHHQQEPPIRRLWPDFRKLASIAAVLILLSGTFLYFFLRDNQPKIASVAKKSPAAKRVQPGGNKAILTLANGSNIVLGGAANGVLARQANIAIRKSSAGTIVYDASNPRDANPATLYNTISTPRGGQYNITLSDGTRVWLNAASSLKFPAAFPGNERIVELSGEAYFEVAKLNSPLISGNGGRIPFKVITAGQTIEVLGTHFNVNAYDDEASVKTTLLEGSVKVVHAATNASRILVPGQQAKVNSGIRISDVDPEQAVAWKNGYFNFSHENIRSIMRQVSRWYDIDIQYEGSITTEGFVGTISRFKDVAEVLEMLQLTGSVRFKTEPNPTEPNKLKIIVMP
jgi:transmembrane sensor